MLTRFNVYNPTLNADDKPELCLWAPMTASAREPLSFRRQLGHALVLGSNMSCPKSLKPPPLPPLLPPSLLQQQQRGLTSSGSKLGAAEIKRHPLLPDIRYHPLRHYDILSDPAGRDRKDEILFKSIHFAEAVNNVLIHHGSIKVSVRDYLHLMLVVRRQ